MPDRISARIFTFGAVAALTLSLLLLPLVIGTGPVEAAGAAATRTCSTAGLRFSERQGGVTLSDAVANLRARAVTCTVARSVASRVARDILRETKVPTYIAGLKVTVKEPCAGCTPVTQVSARSDEGAVTFTVHGGA